MGSYRLFSRIVVYYSNAGTFRVLPDSSFVYISAFDCVEFHVVCINRGIKQMWILRYSSACAVWVGLYVPAFGTVGYAEELRHSLVKIPWHRIPADTSIRSLNSRNKLLGVIQETSVTELSMSQMA